MFRNLQFLISLSLLLVVGCGDSLNSKVQELNATAIQRLSNSYTFFQSRNSFRGPKTEEEFRGFFTHHESQKGFDRAGIDVSDVDALFISPRDDQPFRVKYGVKGSPFGFNEAIIFETSGVDGQIMVGFGGGTTKLMSAEEAEELFSSKTKKKLSRGDSPENIEKIQEAAPTE